MTPEEEARFKETALREKREADVRNLTDKKLIEREAQRRAAAEPRPLLHVPTLVGYTLAELHAHQFPKRRPLLNIGDTAVLRAAEIGQIFGIRGVGKTLLAQTLALVASTGIPALGFSNVDPCRVLYIDGEMGSEEIQDRFDRLSILLSRHEDVAGRGHLFEQLHNGNLVVIGADWQEEFLPRLDTPEGQAAIEPFVEQADFIIPDNRSCLFDSEGEKDPSAWQPAQDYLLSLRRRGKTTMLVHHANRQGGARGISKAEDPMDLIIGLSKPDDYSPEQGARFRVDFEKSRRVHGPAVRPFLATLSDDKGWVREPIESKDEADTVLKKLREYLEAAHAAGERPKSANEATSKAGVNRNAGLKVWAELKATRELVEHAKGGWHLVEVSGGL